MNKHQKLVQQQFINDEEKVIKRLKTIYNQSYKDITGKIKTLDSSIADLQKALADVGEDEIGDIAAAFLKGKPHITPDEAKATLQSMIQSKVYQKNYQKALQKQVDDVLGKMLDKEFTTVSEYINECYENGFIGTMFDLQGQGIPMCFPLDQEAMVRAVQLDSKISQGLYTKLGEDVTLLKRKITAQVSRGISSGMSFQQVAQQLAGYTSIGFNNAVRIARTEGHRVQVQSAMNACYKAKDSGADVLKQWDAAMDKRTRESHAMVDGEIRELDKPFSNGLMYPGDPSGGAGEVVNCRCALLQRARWALDDDELQTLKDRAAYFGLDKAETFDEYKKKYLKAAGDLDQAKTPIDQERVRQRREAWKQRQAAKQQAKNKPDFDSMDRKELVSWASENLKTSFDDVAGANTDYIREAVRVISNLEEKMGGQTIGGLSVKFGGLPSGILAKYDDMTHTVLLKKSGSIKAFAESSRKTNERALRKLGKNYHATETFSGTIWHELGHAVDMDTGQALSTALSATKELDMKSIKISVYAGNTMNVRVTRRSEAWAENFAAYMDGGANSKDVPPEIVQMIEDYFTKKKG